MKHILILLVFISSTQLIAQEEENSNLDPKKGHINVQFVAGFLNSTPVGLEARSIRNGIDETTANNSSYSASLLPKSSAYVGLNVDYQFHKIGAIGFGLTYTPKGYWFFEKDTDLDMRKKTFITVDYFEIPIFYKEYLMDNKLSIRFGPVINFVVISKNRTITTIGDVKEKEKSRLGENGDPLPKEIVPGFETALSFGNLGGFHGNFQFQYMGSMFKDDIDLRSVIFKLGVGYTFSK